jgi:hypothetical protein
MIMQTVIETPAFLASAYDEDISDLERANIVAFIADNPTAGDLMPGSGGARKVRYAARGKGKSGGYRIITYFADEDIPVFLLDIYSKSSQANLSKSELNELKKVLTALPRIWRENAKVRSANERKKK